MGIDDFKKGCDLLREKGIKHSKCLVISDAQLEILKRQGEKVTDKTINGYPYVIRSKW